MKSTYLGVSLNKKSGLWKASFTKDNARHHGGFFEKEEDAALAVDRLRIEHNGDYYKLNFPHLAGPDYRPVRRCKKCGEIKPLEDFSRRRLRNTLGRLWVCKPCGVFRNAKWTASTQENAVKAVLSSAKHRARKKGIEFRITAEQVLALLKKQGGLCALTGNLVHFARSRDRSTAASIDRINNSLGYTHDNIQVVCLAANVAKQAMTVAEFVRLCTAVVAHHSD